jgi:hypothetical protein
MDQPIQKKQRGHSLKAKISTQERVKALVMEGEKRPFQILKEVYPNVDVISLDLILTYWL